MSMLKKSLPFALIAVALTGCASQPKTQTVVVTPVVQGQPVVAAQPAQSADPVVNFDYKKEVAYRCGDKREPMNVMYGIRNNGDVVAAQVKFRNTASNVLVRTNKPDVNAFFSQDSGIGWAALKASGGDVTRVDGIELVQRAVQTVNGQQVVGMNLIATKCRLDKAATAKLNK